MIITVGAPNHIPDRLRPLFTAEPLDFLALHGMRTFDKSAAWLPRPHHESYRAALGTDERGVPVELDVKPPVHGGKMGHHGQVVAPVGDRAEVVRAVLLGQLVRHSPELLEVLFIDFHGTGVFQGLERAPHVRGSFIEPDAALVQRIVDALLAELKRRGLALAASGNYRHTFDYRKARSNGAEVPPLPELLVCVDGVVDLAEAHPEFTKALQAMGRLGRSKGTLVLLSDDTALPEVEGFLGYRLAPGAGGWSLQFGGRRKTFRVPANLDEAVSALPALMARDETAPDCTTFAGLDQEPHVSAATAASPPTPAG